MAIHGGDIYGTEIQKRAEAGIEILDFSANINPLGMPESVRRAVTENLSAAEHYPDPECRKLKQALAKRHGIQMEHLICGNGGAELIYRLAYALRPKKALLTAPTFAEYEEALRQVDTQYEFYQMQVDLQIREDILNQMNDSLDVMFVCNPNNPTGILTPRPLLKQILKKAEDCGILLVLDECFLDFTDQESQSLIPEAAESRNLFILKSFTKMYAMPGIRLGYGISGNTELLRKMEKSGPCWNVSVLASEAGIAALEETDYCEQARHLIRSERANLKEGLEAFGFQVWNGQADYLFFKVPGITDLYERLLPYGILIRRCSNYRGLDDTHYRIAVKSPEANQKLLEVLQKVMTE